MNEDAAALGACILVPTGLIGVLSVVHASTAEETNGGIMLVGGICIILFFATISWLRNRS